MNIAFNRTKRKLKHVSFSAVLAGFAFLILLVMLGYRGYTVLAASRVSSIIAEKEVELLEKKRELTRVQTDPGYLKFLAARYLEQETKTVHREQSLRYLTSLLEELKAYNRQQRTVNLANFTIDPKKITLQGTVSGLKDIYAEGGIIDRFSTYPFIQFFKLPYFRANSETEGYEFLLDADIYHYDGTQPTS